MKFVLQDKTDKTQREATRWSRFPAQYQAQAEEYREHLLEAASHADDELLELVLEGKPVSEELLRKALRTGTLSGKLTPVLCGSSKDIPRRAAAAGRRASITCRRRWIGRRSTGIVPKSKEKERSSASPTRRSRSAAWRSRPSPSRPATWCSCASTPANCTRRTTC